MEFFKETLNMRHYTTENENLTLTGTLVEKVQLFAIPALYSGLHKCFPTSNFHRTPLLNRQLVWIRIEANDARPSRYDSELKRTVQS